MRISLGLHARSHPCDDWQAQLQGMHALRQREAELAAAAAARRAVAGAGGPVGKPPLVPAGSRAATP